MAKESQKVSVDDLDTYNDENDQGKEAMKHTIVTPSLFVNMGTLGTPAVARDSEL